MNKIGQISSADGGVYAAGAYPTEQEFLNEWETLKDLTAEDILVIEEEQSVITVPVAEETVPVQEEEPEEEGGTSFAIMFACFAICFLIPWIFIGVW